MSRRLVYSFDRVVTRALGPNGRYVAMTGLTASAVLLTFNYKFAEAVAASDNMGDIQSPSRLFYLRLLFGRTRSRLWGWLLNKPMSPHWRVYIFEALAKVSGVDVEEIRYPLKSYKCVGHLFAYTLKDKAREIQDISPHALASPADALVLAAGDVVAERVEQVKGATYNLRAFLGVPPEFAKTCNTSRLKFVVLWLRPKDYHHFHSPTHFDVHALRHISGEVLPVFPSFLKRFNDILSVQERVILSGKWLYGAMHFAAVAAYNVGNIRIDAEPDLRTNELRTLLRHLGGDIELKTYTAKPLSYAVGQHIGEFRLGSTVVLVFEAPTEFTWNVKPQDVVRVGDRLGGVGPPKRASTDDERKYAFY